jgi:hypothetical protein
MYYGSHHYNQAPRSVYPTLSAADSQQLCDGLRAVLPQLSERDQTFAASLMAKAQQYGTLTEKQACWVLDLTQRATQPKAAPVQVDLSGVRKMFAAAKGQLKHPKIRLKAGTQPVVLSLAGQRSKYTGQVMVTDGGPFGDNLWFGRVEGDSFHASRHVTQDVTQLLQSLSDDPVAILGTYGRMTGACSLCGRDLTDDESVQRGVGPVCLKKWGLAGPATAVPASSTPAGAVPFDWE